MNSLTIPDFAVTTATFVCSALVLGAGLLAARYWRNRSSIAYFAIKLLIFCCLTALILSRKVVPYRPREQPGDRDAKGLVGQLAESIHRLFALH